MCWRAVSFETIQLLQSFWFSFWPQEKVMTMLADVQTKLIEDGKASDTAHANYTQFCGHGQRDLGYDIQDGEKNVEQLSATIAKSTSEIEVSTSKLQELQGAIVKSEGDLKQAQKLRDHEHQEHQTAHTELGEATESGYNIGIFFW